MGPTLIEQVPACKMEPQSGIIIVSNQFSGQGTPTPLDALTPFLSVRRALKKMKGHTQWGDAPTVLPIELTHRGRDDAPTM